VRRPLIHRQSRCSPVARFFGAMKKAWTSLSFGLVPRPIRDIFRPVILRSLKDWSYRLEVATSLEPAASTVRRISRPTKETSAVVLPKPKEDVVRWSMLIPSILAAAMLIVNIFLWYSTSILPDKVGTVIESSQYLNKRFSTAEESLKDITKKVGDLTQEVNGLTSEVDRMKDPRAVFGALKKAASKDNASLIEELPSLRQALRIMRESKSKIPERAYQEVAARFIKRYSRAPATVKNEIWLTFVEMATTKSATDGHASPLTEYDLERAKRAGKLFDTGVVDLSQHEKWKGTIFKNCRITVSKPKQTLSLVRVKFVDVDFESIPKNQASENLVAALVSSESETITRKVMTAYSVNVVVPCCLHPIEPEDKNKTISLLVRKH
jgi:hypothetical protein